MILFDQIVEILDLPQFHLLRQKFSGFELRDSFGISGILVDIDHARSWYRGGDVSENRGWGHLLFD